jgi:hypothetical protein
MHHIKKHYEAVFLTNSISNDEIEKISILKNDLKKKITIERMMTKFETKWKDTIFWEEKCEFQEEKGEKREKEKKKGSPYASNSNTFHIIVKSLLRCI